MSVVGAYELCQWLEHINCVNGGNISILSVVGAYKLCQRLEHKTYKLCQWFEHINCVSDWSMHINNCFSG